MTERGSFGAEPVNIDRNRFPADAIVVIDLNGTRTVHKIADLDPTSKPVRVHRIKRTTEHQHA